MADEKRRNGGRNEPLVDDNWRLGKKRPKRKPFGLRTSYTYGDWRGRIRTYHFTNWYATERAREEAERAFLAGRGGFSFGGRAAERIER